ncbi:MAG: copper resistance protein CopC [Candidatus Nanopelagicales bacterium]
MPQPAPAHAPRRRHRTILGAAIAASILLVAPFALAAPASAHDELLSTDPADGSSLASAPEAVTLTFGEDVVELGTAVVVVDSAGVKLADGPLVVDGAVITRPITAPTVPGEVTVSYRVVSADGHPVTGRFSFTVAEAASPTPTESGSASGSASASPSEPASPTASGPAPTSSAPGVVEPSTTPVASETSGSALPWVLGGLAVVVLAGAAVAASRRGKAGSGS